jgi:hypothetical protein
MSDTASSAWNTGPQAGPWNHGTYRRCGRRPGRGLEIAGIILGFIFAWPLALAYLVWKMGGYPKYDEATSFFRDTYGRARDDFFSSRGPVGGFGGFASTGNAAFDEYRRKELERLEEERRKLDEEARDFRNFVEELKRAKDREEFDAYMAKRRGNGGNGTTNV